MPGSTEKWEAVKRRVADLGRAHVRAGVVGPPAHQQHGDSGMTNGEIALLHELGNRNLPPRSFVGATMRDPAVQAQFAQLQARVVGLVIEGRMSRDQALGLLGAFMAGAIKRTIVDGKVSPPLAPGTIEAKGSDKVLVDTGQLVGAVGFEVVK